MSAIDYFDHQAAAFRDSYTQCRDFRTRYALWTRLIDRYGSAARSCLDIGCGPGLFSLHAAKRGLQTVGIDPSLQMLELGSAQSKRHGLTNVRFVQAGLPLPTNLPVARADLILCSSVLEYIADLDGAVAGIFDRLNPGGHFLVSLPNSQSLYRVYEKMRYRLTGKPEYYRHVRNVLSVGAARRYFAGFGFACREAHFYGDEPFISRVASRVLGPRFSQNLYVLVLAREAASAELQIADCRLQIEYDRP